MIDIKLDFKPKKRLKMIGTRIEDSEFRAIKKLSLQKIESVSETTHVLIVYALKVLGLL